MDVSMTEKITESLREFCDKLDALVEGYKSAKRVTIALKHVDESDFMKDGFIECSIISYFPALSGSGKAIYIPSGDIIRLASLGLERAQYNGRAFVMDALDKKLITEAMAAYFLAHFKADDA